MSGGWNPLAGHDAGPRPPLGPYGNPIMTPNQAYVPHQGGVHANIPYYNAAQFAYGGVQYQGMMPGLQQPMLHQPMPQQGLFAGLVNNPFQMGGPSLGVNPGVNPRYGQPVPRIDPNMPAAQMTNSTGGLGCEPGYNYFFPAEHTKIHVFGGTKPPWQLPGNANIPFNAIHMPCNLTLGDVLKGLGCTNPNPKKNRCTEVVQGGNGRWYKGLTFAGDDKGMLGMSIKEVGWDISRNGHRQGKPVVCIWATKD